MSLLEKNTETIARLIQLANELPAETDLTPIVEALTEKGQTVPDGAGVDVLASLIAAIEAGGGGGNMFTFTPASTGLIYFTVDVEVGDFVLWFRTDWANKYATAVSPYDRYETFYGFTAKKEDTSQDIVYGYWSSETSKSINVSKSKT